MPKNNRIPKVLKDKKKKKIISIYVDEELWKASGFYIENLSAYFNQCLKNAISSFEKKREEEEDKELRIIENRYALNSRKKIVRNFCKEHGSEVSECLNFDWFNYDM